jgi:PII interaction protein X
MSRPHPRAPHPDPPPAVPPAYPQENYLDHPTFGLLYGLCRLGETAGLFTTLYAQRLFFRVSVDNTGEMSFESLSRQEARQLVEEQLRCLRRLGNTPELAALQAIYQRTFA